jgi:hypothetical protein
LKKLKNLVHLLHPDGHLDPKEPDVELVVAAQRPDRVLGRRDPLELDAQELEFAPLEGVRLQREQPPGGVCGEQHLVRLHASGHGLVYEVDLLAQFRSPFFCRLLQGDQMFFVKKIAQ